MDHNLNIALGKKSGGLSRRVLVIVFLVLVTVPLAALIGWQLFAQYRGERAVEELAVRLQTYEQDLLNAKMDDRYGGSTPQETLRLYIDAVESGDYELASKYFIERKRSEELNGLKDSDKEKLPVYLNSIRSAYMSRGYYSDDKISFSIEDPIAIDFEKYPNGVWKIVEI